MTPNTGLNDAIGLHFVSVLSHIERAAKEAGTTVTIHDASKPAHVLLSRGALVGQARRTQTGHSKAGGRGVAAKTGGGPSTANMVRSNVAIGSARHYPNPTSSSDDESLSHFKLL